MTLPSPFFAQNLIIEEIQPKVKVSKFYRDPHQIQPIQQAQFISYCKFCKEGFSNNFELSQHRRNHVKCPYDECKFNANEATVANHIQRTHLKESSIVKIQDLTTPEQIEKWRDERRKRYPTTQNVILRQKQQEEKMKRGERLKESKSRFGDQKQRNFVKNMGKNDQQHHKRSRHKRPKRNGKFDKKQDKEDEELTHSKLTGSSQLKTASPEKVVKEQSALSMLGMYGSDSENEDDKVADTSAKEVKVEDDNDDMPEEIPTVKQSIEDEKLQQQIDDNNLESRKRKRENRKDVPRKIIGLDYSRIKKSGNPFLEKLLKSDIVHERNILLQCVNYVVRNNFFGVGQKEAFIN